MELKAVVIRPKGTRKFASETHIRNLVSDALSATQKEAETLMKQIVATWRHEVEFTKSGVSFGKDAKASVYTTDHAFWYLDNGVPTKAKMPKGFVPKTSVRSYKSRAGSKGAEDPVTYKDSSGKQQKVILRKPIVAREWTDMLAEDMEIVLVRKMRQKFGNLVLFR